MSRVWRFIPTYRWEILLILGVGVLGNISYRLTTPLLYALLCPDGRCGGPFDHFQVGLALASLLEAALLALVYKRIRRLDRPFLALVWQYAIAVALLWTLLRLVTPLVISTGDEYYGEWRLFVNYGRPALSTALMLWFARKASIFGLAHGFFLFLVLRVQAPISGVWDVFRFRDHIATTPDWQEALASMDALVFGFVLAWLLGNFASRQHDFQWRVVVALTAIYLLVPALEIAVYAGEAWHGWSGMEWVTRMAVSAVLPLLLIYAVRVRRQSRPTGDIR